MKLKTVAAAFITLLLFTPPSACAHARLVKANPENTARLTAAPAQIELWFNELLDDGFNVIEVFPSDQLGKPKHDNFAKGTPQVDAKNRTHLTIAVGPLKPGSYVVNYRVLSRDGHPAPGRIAFHIAASIAAHATDTKDAKK